MKTPLLITALAGIALAGSGSAAIVNAGAATGYHSTDKDWLSNTTNDIDSNGWGTDWVFFDIDADGTYAYREPNACQPRARVSRA